jgi:hypothetical protein
VFDLINNYNAVRRIPKSTRLHQQVVHEARGNMLGNIAVTATCAI